MTMVSNCLVMIIFTTEFGLVLSYFLMFRLQTPYAVLHPFLRENPNPTKPKSYLPLLCIPTRIWCKLT